MSLYDTHLSKAQEFYDEGNYEAARHALAHALDANPPQGDTRAHALLAFTYRRLEFDDEALKLFEICVNANPTPNVRAELALILAEKGCASQRALDLANSAASEDPDINAAYLARFLVYAKRGEYLPALKDLKSAIRRGADYPDNQAFELIRDWCQKFCDDSCYEDAFNLSNEVADFFASFDFYILNARLADFAQKPRIAVDYYKRALAFLRQGNQMRIDILEAIARIAV